ncbi:extracellular solute-binding protein [Paenibacillus sedimenti]|uniref:Extracellular solute-binding protein n=1 Tax=Paenibacillus sedimenti TaxID=2770274 RepID=A0A926KVH4_9BACL|nr:extracellular solute-binding protein [Paenibacillus sedimenti]MBD0384063.1 extracellular solute-binding protein [Paenibacillus sedimenti]
MKARFKQIAVPAIALTLGLSTLLTACSTKEPAASSSAPKATDSAKATKAPDPATLKFMFFGDKPTDLDKVLAKFEERTKDTLNTKIEFDFVPGPEFRQKALLKMSTGESFDLTFDAPWATLYNHLSLGYYQPLDKYFNNDAYPGLKKAFPAEMMEANKINGHIYTIPFQTAYADPFIIGIRKDVREKLGLPPVKSMADFNNYLEAVRTKLPDYVPMVIGGRGIFRLGIPEEKGRKDIRLAAIKPESFTGGVPFSVAISPDGKKVLGAATIGDPDSEFAKFPAPFNTHDSIYGHFGVRTDYRKYTNKDPLSKQAVDALDQNKQGAIETTISNLSQDRLKLKKINPNADYEPFFYTSDDIRDMKPGAIRTTFIANNSAVVPASSKNVERTMKFLDWMFSSRENHDLIELGIEGEHWTVEGANGFKTTDKSSNYKFPGYEMTWNPTLSRMNTSNEPEVIKYVEYAQKTDSYYQVPLSNFVFDTKPVATELAKINPKLQQAYDILMTGLDPNWKQFTEKSNKEWRELGLEKVRAEVLKQVQAYLDKGGK